MSVNDKNIENVIIPDGITSIGNHAFRTCSGFNVPLKQVEVPMCCKIEDNAFEDYCKVICK